MKEILDHIVIIPIILPLIAAAFMLLLDERRRILKNSIGIGTMVVILIVSCIFFTRTYHEGVFVYHLGNWRAPYGIVLVSDLLSSTMVLLTSILGLAAILFSFARWDRAGPRFQPLFMLQIMGVNGAFLTGDLFNLFVFFEVMLAASYALALHGSGLPRVKAGLHYVVINLVASSLFLVGASLIYGVTGTLNIADLALKAGATTGIDRTLFDIGFVILGVAFLIKVGMWPLGFWLPSTYSAASAPVAAIFAILSKVGIYVVIRTSVLLSGTDMNAFAGFSAQWMFVGGLITMIYGSVLALASRTLSRLACSCVFISSGTLLSVISVHSPEVLASGIFYMLSSTLAVSAFFLLIELLNRARGTNAPVLSEPVFSDEYQDPYEDGMPDEKEIIIIPVALALLSGGFFLCALLLIGLPPMSGFIGKLTIMMSLMDAELIPIRHGLWIFIGIMAMSSLATLIALIRIGVEVLWIPEETTPPKVARVEFISIAGLLMVSVALTIFSGPIMGYIDKTSAWLYSPGYINAVLPQSVPIPEKKP